MKYFQISCLHRFAKSTQHSLLRYRQRSPADWHAAALVVSGNPVVEFMPEQVENGFLIRIKRGVKSTGANLSRFQLRQMFLHPGGLGLEMFDTACHFFWRRFVGARFGFNLLFLIVFAFLLAQLLLAVVEYTSRPGIPSR